MTALAHRAFAAVRTRSMRGRLLDPEAAERLRTARDPAALSAALRDLGLPSDPIDLEKALWGRFAADAAAILKAGGGGEPLLRAIAGTAEIENLKLGWRARVRDLAEDRWLPWWRPLGAVARLPAAPFREAHTLDEAVAGLVGTPYAEVAGRVLRSAGADLAAAEHAFDRHATGALIAAARALPAADAGARDLALGLAREREIDALLRLRAARGVSSDVAVAAAVLLAQELRPAALRSIAEWNQAAGPLSAVLPKGLPAARDPADLLAQLRSARARACQRAFVRAPFGVELQVALFLLHLSTLRAAVALVEAHGAAGADPVLDRALAASAMG